jgi:hypothetical protein
MGPVNDQRQVEALNQVLSRYETWRQANERLHQEMSHASRTSAPSPVPALQADFTAQRDLTRAAIDFATTCGTQGPDLTAVAGPAFVHALYQAAAVPDVEAELNELDDAMRTWWPLLRTWTPADGDPPPRPRSAAQERILDALTNWREFLDDQAHDQMLDSLADQGAKITRSFVRDADGSMTTYTSAQLNIAPPEEQEPGHAPPPVGTLRRDGLSGHLAGLWRPPLQVRVCGRDGQSRPLSAHWSAARAYRNAHQARTEITPGSWIELWEWRIRGLELLDLMPWMDPSEVASNGDELIYGVLDQTGNMSNVGVIGTIRPMSRGWTVTVRDRSSETFQTPRFRDAIYPTRAQAMAGIATLFERLRDE